MLLFDPEHINRSRYYGIVHGKTSEEIVTALLDTKGEIELDYYSLHYKKLIDIILDSEALLNKCSENTLMWLLNKEDAVEKIMDNPDIMVKITDGTLANLAEQHGMLVWEKIRQTRGDKFTDHNLCLAAKGQEDIALDIISDDEKVKKIAGHPLNYHFYGSEKVALALINNPVFMQETNQSTILSIAFQHTRCAQELYEKRASIQQIQEFNNSSRLELAKKYPFWRQALNANELKRLTQNATEMRTQIRANPSIVITPDEHGRTILHHVAMNHSGQDSNAINRMLGVLFETHDENGNTPLHNFDALDENGNTPLHIAASRINYEVASLTLQRFIAEKYHHYANMDLQNNNDHTLWDVLQENLPNDFFYSRGLDYPVLSLSELSAAVVNQPDHEAAINAFFVHFYQSAREREGEQDDAFRDVVEASFNSGQQDNREKTKIDDSDIVSVQLFLKNELHGTCGLFKEELETQDEKTQLTIIQYLLALHGKEKDFAKNDCIEKLIAKLDEFKVMLSIEDAINKVTHNKIFTPDDVGKIRKQFLIDLTEYRNNLLAKLVDTKVGDLPHDDHTEAAYRVNGFLRLINTKAGDLRRDGHTGAADHVNSFLRQLKLIDTEAQNTRHNGHTNAADCADELLARITLEAVQFCTNVTDRPTFKKNCSEAIATARPTLEVYPGWKQILINLALAVAGLGIFYAGAVLINKSVTGNFLFFQTDLASKFNTLEKTIDSVKIP